MKADLVKSFSVQDAGAAAMDPAFAERIAADLEAVFLSSDEGPETQNTPHSLKGGVVFNNQLKTQAPQESAPLSVSDWKQAGKGAAPDALAEVFAGFRFDWIQGVIPAPDGGGECVVGGPIEADAVARAIRFFESIGLRMGEPVRGGKGYEHALPFTEGLGRESVASVASGSHTGGMPNIKMSGGRGFCAVAAPRLLSHFPGLRITRADACIDISAPDAFALIHEAAVKMARARKMDAPEMFGTQTPEKGLTLYMGAKQSEVRARVYQKGLQLISQGQEADPEWVRVEFQFSNLPGRKKAGFGKLTPGEMVRAYLWPRQFVAIVAKVIGMTDAMRKAERAKVETVEVMKDLHTSAQHGAKQYAKTFTRLAIQEIAEERCGGDVSALCVDAGELSRKAAAIFLRTIRETDKVEKVIEADRVQVSETPAQRAQMVADKTQAARMRAIERRARSYNRLALTVSAASTDADAIAAAHHAAADHRHAAETARADVHDVRADADKRREAAASNIIPFNGRTAAA